MESAARVYSTFCLGDSEFDVVIANLRGGDSMRSGYAIFETMTTTSYVWTSSDGGDDADIFEVLK